MSENNFPSEKVNKLGNRKKCETVLSRLQHLLTEI